MLVHLHIRNLALCDQLDIEIHPGLTVLTGETGAGKSILIGAIGMALGQRADAALVRIGAERAEITLEFDIAALPDVQAWLAEQDLDDQGACQLRRVVNREGRSRAYINGSPAPLQQLTELGDLLLDIHGQHEHHTLLKKEYQRLLLDRYGDHQAQLDAVGEAWHAWRTVERQIQDIEAASSALSEDQLELLRHQVQELDTLRPGPGELDGLVEELRRLAHADTLMAVYQQGLELLDGDEQAVAPRLNHVCRALQGQLENDGRLTGVIEMLESAAIQISEAASDLTHHLSDIDVDPGRLREVEDRLAQIQDLARKHRVPPEDLPEVLERLREQLEYSLASQGDLTALYRRRDEAEARYLALAEELRTSRIATAQRLSAAVIEHMRELGMPHGRMEIRVERFRDGRNTQTGRDDIGFLISTNPSLPPAPLERAASGGELSRISLAIQVVTARQGTIPTIIFDEVDVGIGGRVAEIVGQHLRSLAADRQVLCITHLPQVAALGGQHLRVVKTHQADNTSTRLQRLEGDDRRDEVARMLGGIEITRQTLDLADEMLERAGQRFGEPVESA
ncbi:MAG: DNA repair protein RecN [Gammaproteobacteria bacterium]|nr:DNA repair protein RecN [Gammaproteobacteria bacterium]